LENRCSSAYRADGIENGQRAPSEDTVAERRDSEMTTSQAAAVETPDWSELLSRTVDDLSRIARTEMELLGAVTRRLIETQTDKLAGAMVMLVAISHGSLFILGGMILLIHLWLAWWLAFMLTGFGVICAGVLLRMSMTTAASGRA
jgi:hypothetical protein